MDHPELASEADFDKLLQASDKYVLIYAYEGDVPAKAREYARLFSGTTIAYMVNVSEFQDAKEYFVVIETPVVILFKDGRELRRVVGTDEAGMAAVANMLL